MDAPTPKKRPWQRQSNHNPKKQVRKHLNKRFYNSKAWRDTRKAYILNLRNKVWNECRENKIVLRGATLEITTYQAAYIMSLDYPICEQCLKMFSIGVYDTIREGKELDHIYPLNPEDALDSKEWGDPFNQDNLQLLCRPHHAKKSNRDKKITQIKT